MHDANLTMRAYEAIALLGGDLDAISIEDALRHELLEHRVDHFRKTDLGSEFERLVSDASMSLKRLRGSDREALIYLSTRAAHLKASHIGCSGPTLQHLHGLRLVEKARSNGRNWWAITPLGRAVVALMKESSHAVA